MSVNTQWDSLDYQVLDFPYNRIETELSPNPRIFRGSNTCVTRGGKLIKRPGTLTLDGNNTVTGRIDRLWQYETLESPANVYLIASIFTGTYWELWTKRLTTPTAGWVQAPALRDCNLSTRPHELAANHGKAYAKSFPSPASSEKLGTVILDGEGGTIATRPWGLLGPSTPAVLKGGSALLTADISSSATTITVTTDVSFPGATPFYIQVGYEQMQVTAGVPGTSWTVVRGVNGTTAVEHFANEVVIYLDWSASDHIVEVNYGWTYSYAYKSITGHVSNRAPLQSNPDKMPSTTGPFFDMCPEIIVQGQSDTTNIPTIVIYRTTDGGGTFYKLDEIPNVGAGSIIYVDNSLESGSAGGTFNDPIPDAVLDQFDIAPSLVSNSPPPAVLAPEVTGVDTPAASTPIATFQSRLWYAIGNTLFFSAEEELNEGIPEEAWPSGAQNGRNGNFYRFPYPITNLAETTSALYVFTIQCTYKITGNNLETFSPKPVFENFGSPAGHPRAITRFGDTIAFLTHDYRICLIEGEAIQQISDPLFTDLVDQLNQNGEYDLKYFGDLDKEWLIVTSHRKDDPQLSRQWIYDIRKSLTERKPFWFTPWTIRSVASLSSRTSDTSSQRRLVFAVYNPATNTSGLSRIDPTYRTGSDYFLGTTLGFDFVAEFHQMTVPPGNHVNALRAPAVTPTVYGVAIDRLLFAGDSDPQAYWYYDDLWTDPDMAVRSENPPRRTVSKGYKTLLYTIHRACQHFSARISKLNSTELFEIVRFTVIWDPDSGS